MIFLYGCNFFTIISNFVYMSKIYVTCGGLTMMNILFSVQKSAACRKIFIYEVDTRDSSDLDFKSIGFGFTLIL